MKSAMLLYTALAVLQWSQCQAADGHCSAPPGAGVGSSCQREMTWLVDHSMDDQLIEGSAVQTHPQAVPAAKCALLCMQQDCGFFFYNKDTKTCVTCPKPCHDVTLTPAPGYRFYGNQTMIAVIPVSTSCADVRQYYPTSGVRQIQVGGFKVTVFCDQDTNGGNWTVIQRRQDATTDFYRPWADYCAGFGNANANVWMGLDLIHNMTKSGNFTLRVDLTDFNGATGYAEYAEFCIDGASANYTLHISGYSGTAGDSLNYHNNMAFSTYDRDNYRGGGVNCAASYHGAWWYNYCAYSNLNGLYKSSAVYGNDGVVWYTLGGWISLKRSEMKIRPK